MYSNSGSFGFIQTKSETERRGGRNLLPNRPILGTSKVAVAEESPAESTHTASENEKRKSD